MSEIDEKFAEYCRKMFFSQPIKTNYHSDIAEEMKAAHDAEIRRQTIEELLKTLCIGCAYLKGIECTNKKGCPCVLGQKYVVEKANELLEQMKGDRLNCGENSDCDECEYFGRPSDAPETVEKDCMWRLIKELRHEEDLPLCVRRLGK